MIAACTHVPNEIDVQQSTVLVPFEDVSKTTPMPEQMGEKARWGGKIAQVVNKKDVSEIEIVFFPELRSGKPKVSDESIGRFKAVVDGFVDPMVFEQGRLITVVGSIGKIEEGLIGEQAYNYPTINAEGYYMWRKTADVEVETIGFSPFIYGSRYHNSFFYPWYDPWWFSRSKQRVKVIYKDAPAQGGRDNSSSNNNSSTSNRGSGAADKPQISQPKPRRNNNSKRD